MRRGRNERETEKRERALRLDGAPLPYMGMIAARAFPFYSTLLPFRCISRPARAARLFLIGRTLFIENEPRFSILRLKIK